MNDHDYTAEGALELLLRKLDAANADLATQVRAAINAGKDIEEERPRSSRRNKALRYRKAVSLSKEEALAAAVDVLQAYFIEQPLFVSSAMDDARSAALAAPRTVRGVMREERARQAPDTGLYAERIFEIELRAETQLTPGGDETHRLEPPSSSQLEEQRKNVSHLRALLRFESE